MSPTRARFAEVVRSEPVDLGLACLLVGGEVDRSLDVDASLATLDALASTARPLVPRVGVVAMAEGLQKALADFSGAAEDYEDLRSSLLHSVLERRRGLPLLLSVVWLEVAARLSVPAYAVALPGHVVVGIGDPEDEHVLVDPFVGGTRLDPVDAPLLSANDLLLRLLTNVRALTTRMPPSLDVARTRLWAVELSLLLPRHPLELRRERGELLVRLGAHLDGAEELETFALAVADADQAAADVARREARLARAQLN
ncbi:MAG: tetratricopeptide repeat protein [Frankiales bacterium]|nr:MAG: tetratricopeptide repeat protein [Frankiales bacterium]